MLVMLASSNDPASFNQAQHLVTQEDPELPGPYLDRMAARRLGLFLQQPGHGMAAAECSVASGPASFVQLAMAWTASWG